LFLSPSEVSNPALLHAMCHYVLLHHGPETMESSDHALKHLKLWAKMNHFSFVSISNFVTVIKIWLTPSVFCIKMQFKISQCI
jgi:hypothetical protein